MERVPRGHPAHPPRRDPAWEPIADQAAARTIPLVKSGKRGATIGAGHGELLIRDIIRHDGCGGWPRKAEQLTVVEGASSRHRRPSGRTIGYRLASVTGSVASSLDADTISDRC